MQDPARDATPPRKAADGHVADAPLAGRARRTASLFYEVLLLVPVLMAGALPLTLLADRLGPALTRALLQITLASLVTAYFSWQWTHGGQTLAMRTWRLRLVTRDGGRIGWRTALARLCFAALGTLAGGAGFAWAFFDREGQFLHDRLAGTRIVLGGR